MYDEIVVDNIIRGHRMYAITLSLILLAQYYSYVYSEQQEGALWA